MATPAVLTPTKARNGLSRRANLTTSPPHTPQTPKRDSPIIYNGNPISRLQKHISRQGRGSPKSNIALQSYSPRQLELGISDWALTGTSPATTKQNLPRTKKESLFKPRNGKSNARLAANTGDRFIPNRTASSALTNVGNMKINSDRPRSSHSNQGSSLLAGAASSFHIGRSTEEEVALALEGLTLDGDDGESTAKQLSPNTIAYHSSLAEACELSLDKRILAFKPAPPESTKPVDLRSQFNRPLKPTALSSQFRRKIATAPERVLDAPNLVDDYYLNLLDWSSGNQIAVGLDRSVYVWSAESGDVYPLFECKDDTYISSVKWSGDGAYIGVGLGSGEVQIWDVSEGKKMRNLRSHDARVGALGWTKFTLTTGDRSGNLYNHDVRIEEHKIADLVSHTGEICGLEWRSDGTQLATGANDNLVNIWDARSLSTPKFSKTNHKAAVKAVAWCPWQSNLLATGGGSHDRHIHFWNSTTGARTNSIDTGSQVTSLRWSTNYKEIVSTSGFPDNSINIWGWPSLVKNIEIPAHESRVLHSCLSPDGQMLATAAADESLKFWKVFEKKSGPSLPTPASLKFTMEDRESIR